MERSADVVVIGGGQAGLTVGHYLAKQGLNFVILEGHDRIGESWRRRWDTLRVFTRARYDGLPGMPFPAPPDSFPTKDDVADYLETYAREMRLPVELGVRVERLVRTENESKFTVLADERRFRAGQVVVATGGYSEPQIPAFAGELNGEVLQLHSSEYGRAAQLRPGAVLVVGAGNSGGEIAYSAAAEHETWLVGRDTGQMPWDINGTVARLIDPPFWFLIYHVLTVGTPMGRRAVPSALAHGTPLERVRKADLVNAGVKRIYARATGSHDGLPQLADGQVLDVANVVWATGFRHDYPWIDLPRPVIGEDGMPMHERGVSTVAPGLYFVGLPFQYSLASSLMGGVGRDARYVVDRIAETVKRRAGQESATRPDYTVMAE